MTATSRRRRSFTSPTVLIGAAFAVAAVAVLVDRDSALASVGAISAPLAAAGFAIGRGALCRDRRRLGWMLIGAAMLANAVGDVIWQILLLRGDEPLGISAADPAYLATYPLLLAGVWRLVSAEHEAPRDVFVDAGIISAFAGLGLWQFLVVNPGLPDVGSLPERVVLSAYPLMGTMTIAALVAILIASGTLTRPMLALAVFCATFVICDILFAVIQNAELDMLRGISDASYVVAYGVMVFAARAQPRARPADARDGAGAGFGRRRLVMLGVALIGAPISAGLAPALDYAAQTPIYIGVAAAVSVTVMLRLAGLVHGLDDERRHLRAAESELAFRATHDDLTKLPNRAHLIDHLTRDLAARPLGDGTLAVMFIDLDNFKNVNDSLGHRAGDDLLGQVGRRLRQSMRTGDLVARIGGDEFVVLCREVGSSKDAEMMAERVRQALSAPFLLDGDVVHIAASIGIGMADDGHDAAMLLRDADIALYEAKAAGRHCVRVFDDAMREVILERNSIETGLRRALDRGELVVLYQPRVDLRTGRVDSLEALLRWPGRPDVTIPRLIDIAESSGLIDEVGWFVLSRACQDIRRLNAACSAPRPISVAVNVSMRQVNGLTFVEDVRRTIALHEVDPTLVSIELTETFLATEPQRAFDTLSELRDVGVRVEIDDFGTGYSSLGRLRMFPLDGVKIDRSFVAGIEGDPGAAAMIATIVTLSAALGLEVTAEGIETPRQAALIRDTGCDLGQGYHFGRPAPIDELMDMIVAPVGEATEVP